MVMMRMRKNRNRLYPACSFVWFSFLVVILSACVSTPHPLANVTPLTSTSMLIYPSMTRNYSRADGMLNIYVDADGWPNVLTPVAEQETEERTAILWLVIVGRPETYTSCRVRSGETIVFEGFKIKILRIDKDDRGAYFVEIEVTEAK
jgi:hypothetical protein